MSYCPKCGNKVDETMTFCPRCGAALKVEAAARPAAPQAPRRGEKAEKQEKGEKREKNEPEKGEKHEKGEYGFVGWLIGGLVLIVVGLFAYASVVNPENRGMYNSIMLVTIGAAIIVVAVYFATRARKRSPPP
jgi:uncharacterized membrane protein YvbJ